MRERNLQGTASAPPEEHIQITHGRRPHQQRKICSAGIANVPEGKIAMGASRDGNAPTEGSSGQAHPKEDAT